MKLNITGIIGLDYIPQTLREEIENKSEDLEITLSSIGGIISSGIEIHNMISQYPGKTKVTLSGTVASIAAYISTAFDQVEAFDNAAFMIHNAYSMVYGDSRDHEKESIELKKLNALIANKYVERTGMSKPEILNLMDNETWYYGTEIKDSGFADSIVKSSRNTDSKDNVLTAALNMWKDNKSKIYSIPDNIPRAAMLITNNKTNAADDGVNNNREKPMNKAEIIEALKTLKTNAEITLPEIAQALNLEVLLITDEQRAALSKMNLVQKEIGTGIDILDWVTESKNVIKQTKEARRENVLTESFGNKIFAETKKENEARLYAEKLCQGKEITPELVKEITEDPIYKKLNAQLADANSDINNITGISEEKRNQGTDNGPAVVTY